MPKMKAYTRKYVPLREKSCKMLEKFMVSTWDEVIVLVVSEEALAVGETMRPLDHVLTPSRPEVLVSR